MRAILSLFVCILLNAKTTYSQQPDTSARKSFLCVVETNAVFGNSAGDWKRYLKTNLDTELPRLMGAPAGVYTVRVQFIILKDGSVKTIKAKSNCGYGMEEELIRVISASKWSPAQRNGRCVNSFMEETVIFEVAKNISPLLVSNTASPK